MPLARAQEAFAEAGQMLALDPPNPGGSATVGGVVACGDSGPLRHRYGAARDLLLGMRVALADGTLARSGGRVIKNVAGYDLAKLFAGSFGTLGMIVEVVVRLHPLPAGRRTTVAGVGTDPGRAGPRRVRPGRARRSSWSALDVRWGDGARGGAGPRRRARRRQRARRDAPRRDARRSGSTSPSRRTTTRCGSASASAQRSAEGTVVRVSGVRSELPAVLRAAERAPARGPSAAPGSGCGG